MADNTPLQVNIRAVLESSSGSMVLWHWEASYGLVRGFGGSVPAALEQLAMRLIAGEYPGDEIMQATQAAMLALSPVFKPTTIPQESPDGH